MNKLTREQLMSLEEYAEQRGRFRADVMAHKRNRKLLLGSNIRILFEDFKTIQYQIQEMLRIEKIFERAGIEDELEAYNPLIPDGKNLKATMMIEYDDPIERKQRLAELIGVEKVVYLQVEGFEQVYPITNEDMQRQTEDKTSSVHFLRFEFSHDMIAAWRSGANIVAGLDHPNYQVVATALDDNLKRALEEDFTPAVMIH
ncbi:MAG: hypothetical protein ACI88A_000304 [Paraglaciecola sp.]|jgi:hypothetical protein